MSADFPSAELTQLIIAAAFRVHNELGAGFLETVYVRALQVELRLAQIEVAIEVPIVVRYRDHIVGEFRADILVANEVIVEVKAVTELAAAHSAQLLNYLQATGKSVGLLVNFGRSVEIQRKIHSKNLRSSAKSA